MNSNRNTLGNKIRQWSRTLHRDLSFFFAGVIVVYALSGLVLNHRRSIDPNYIIEVHRFNISSEPNKEAFDRARVLTLLEPYREKGNYTRHYFPTDSTMKVFLKGGSSMELNLMSGEGIYESVRKRPIISSFHKLHFNTNRWWIIFSDAFAISLIIITLTGMIMNKGKRGLRGRGGIELMVGILIPLLFLWLV